MSETELVNSLIDAFNCRDVDRILSHFADDAVYHNMPMEPVQGLDAIRNVVEMFVNPADSINWETLYSAQSGTTVLNERADHFVIGGQKVTLPVMGAFDVADGKIVAWRDYFDMATWTRQTS